MLKLFVPIIVSLIGLTTTLYVQAESHEPERSTPRNPMPNRLSAVRVSPGTFQRQHQYFDSLLPITDLETMRRIGHDLTCERYDKTDAEEESLLTMPATLEFAEGPAGWFSADQVKMVVVTGLWGSNVPFRFQLIANRPGLFDVHYMPLALAWGTKEYKVGHTSIELRLDRLAEKMAIRTELVNQITGKDDGVMYVCKVSPVT